MLAGLAVIWLSVRMRKGQLPRNSIAGVRTHSTMRSDEAFRIANQTAAPLTGAGGVLFIVGGIAAAIIGSPTAGGPALLAGVLGGAALCVIGATIGVRACR